MGMLPYKNMITTSYIISYFRFNFNRKSAYCLTFLKFYDTDVSH